MKDWKSHFAANQVVNGRILKYVTHSGQFVIIMLSSLLQCRQREEAGGDDFPLWRVLAQLATTTQDHGPCRGLEGGRYSQED